MSAAAGVRGRPGRRRALAALGAVLAPLLVWLVAGPLLGQRLRVSDGSGRRTLEVGPVQVAFLALGGAGAGTGAGGGVGAGVRAEP